MASHITDPKDFAQHINEQMLSDFLRMQTPPIDFEIKEDTKTAKKKRVDDDTIERFIKTIESLSDKSKAEYLFTEMVYINTLSSERHTTNLENQALEDNITFDIEGYGKCANHDERALWWYIHHKNIFDKYFERADTENLAGLKEIVIKDEHIIEKEKIADETKLATLGEGVAKIYENALRGKKFKVSHFLEKDCILVRVYLENLPDNQLVFGDDKNGQTIKRTPSIRSLFSIVMVYSPSEKTLGIRTTNPAENVPKLADLFCRTFLNCTYAETTERKYNVENKSSVQTLELTPDPTDTSIERCYLKAVEYMRKGDTTKTMRLDIGGKQSYTGTEAMEEYIKATHIVESEWIPKKFEIKFIFKKEDETKGRKRQITANLTKRGVNLKNTLEDQKIRQFLKAKGFIS